MAQARSFLGAGYIYVGRYANGVVQALGPKTYADKLEITPKSDTKEATSKGADDYGQVLASVQIAQPTEFEMDLTEVSGDTLVMQFMGTKSAYTQSAATLAATAFTIKAGETLELGKKNFTSIVVTNSAGSTTYVEGVDYTASKRAGFVSLIDGGAIVDGDSIKISGAYAAIAGSKIIGQTQSEIRARIFFDGVNKADGSKVQLEIHEAVMAASSAFDFLADDFGKLTLSGKLSTPAGKSAPYEVITFQ